MLGWKLFVRAVTLIVDNLGAALRVSLVPYGLLIVVNLIFLGSTDMTAIATFDPVTAQGEAPDLPEGFWLGVITTLVVQIFAFVWIAVAWHRFVLLSEGGDAWLPALRGREMLGYFGRSILIFLIILAIMTAVMVLIGVLVPVVGLPLAVILAIIVGYRLGLILPAGAIGKPLVMGEAWQATKGHSGTVVVLAILSFVLSLLLQVPTLVDAFMGSDLSTPEGVAAAGTQGPIAVVYNLVIGWMLLLLGVSILSTLYGHFVEGRPVD